jgi:hypothetical protein
MPQAGASAHPDALWSDHEWEETAVTPGAPVRARSSAYVHPAPGVPARPTRSGAPARSRVESAIPERPAQGVTSQPVTAESQPSQPAHGAGVPGRPTVRITGYGSQRNLIYATREPRRRRPPERAYERAGFKPDRVALWAVVLGVLLVLVATTSAHAATLLTLAGH